MIRNVRAELIRSVSRSTGLVLLLCLAFAMFAMANAPQQDHTPLWGFRQSAIFIATVLLGRAATVSAADYSTGAIRSWLISSPRRLPTVTGKVIASVLVTVVFVAVLAVVAFVFSCVLGTVPSLRDISTTIGGLALAAFGFTLFGNALGVLTRSVPAALALGLAWILPAEHVLDGPVHDAESVLPGLVSQDVTHWELPAGLSWGSAIGHALVPFVVLQVIAVVWFVRRNVTS